MRCRPIPSRPVSPSRAPSRQLTLRKKAGFSLFAIAACLLFLELGARVIEVWVPPLVVDYGQGFDPESRLFVRSSDSPGMMRTRNEKLASFLDQEFTAKKPAGTLRIIA